MLVEFILAFFPLLSSQVTSILPTASDTLVWVNVYLSCDSHLLSSIEMLESDKQLSPSFVFSPQSIKTYSAPPTGLALINILYSLNAEETKVFKPPVLFKGAIMFKKVFKTCV